MADSRLGIPPANKGDRCLVARRTLLKPARRAFARRASPRRLAPPSAAAMPPDDAISNATARREGAATAATAAAMAAVAAREGAAAVAVAVPFAARQLSISGAMPGRRSRKGAYTSPHYRRRRASPGRSPPRGSRVRAALGRASWVSRHRGRPAACMHSLSAFLCASSLAQLRSARARTFPKGFTDAAELGTTAATPPPAAPPPKPERTPRDVNVPVLPPPKFPRARVSTRVRHVQRDAAVGCGPGRVPPFLFFCLGAGCGGPPRPPHL
eukprot:325547-Chlamydomonas_euryale.AAC.4